MIYSENADNFKAYGVAGHRHHPEIVEALENIAGKKDVFEGLLFVPRTLRVSGELLAGMTSTNFSFA
ncbi:hypothetical protein [Acinetobacter baumannii]|uniref:hypothetical protein n=1 Tax=Acinetobacter baumannii TaxID=470 RepID=UPI0039174DBF